ncbi:MAG: hypothetical protein WBP45_15605 [Daejeonella sp.]
MITNDDFRKYFLGFNVLGCTVRNKDVFCFVAQEDYTQEPDWDDDEPEEEELKKRLIIFIRTKPQGQQWSAAQLTGFNGILIGFSPVPPKPQVIVAGVSGGIYATGSGESYMEEISDIYDNGPKRGAIIKLKTIGEHLYVCGNNRSVGRRDGKDRWFGHSNQIPEAETSILEGFSDIDGFNENDIYTIGGAGDVWHFNGKSWNQCAFKNELMLTSICCAGDGNVYISGLGGNVFKGSGDNWKQIYEGEITIPFKDMVWYEERVWCTSDYGIWTIKEDKLEEAIISSEVKICAGNLSVRDGVLLIAGHGGAAFCQDGKWSIIFNSMTMPEDGND